MFPAAAAHLCSGGLNLWKCHHAVTLRMAEGAGDDGDVTARALVWSARALRCDSNGLKVKPVAGLVF